MKTQLKSCIVTALCGVVVTLQVYGQGTAFSYGGRLADGGAAAGGLYDLRFTIYDAAAVGNAVAGPLTKSATSVSDGLFTVTLDFGVGVFTGAERWLEVAVRTNGAGLFAPLDPRQKIYAAPYAILAGETSSTNAARLNVSNTATPATAVPVINSGFIIGATVTYGGSGYFSPPAVTVSDATGSGAVLTATVAGGQVTALTVNSAGSGYSSGATLTIGAPPSNAYQVFPGTNYFNNPGNTFAGTFAGNGAGLTGLNAASLSSGTVPDARIAAAITRDSEVLPMVLAGDGAGSGLDADLFDGQNSAAFAWLNVNQTFSGQNTFINAANSFTGNGAGLTSLSANALASGLVPDARLAATIARDSEILPMVLAGDGSGSGLDADLLDGMNSSGFASAGHNHDSSYWRLTGNAGTTPGTHFLGTTDNQPLEIKVNGLRAARVEYAGGMPNVILGSPVNFVGPGVVGTTIAGGGASSFTNSILANYGAMGGGRGNRIAPQASNCSIAGGQINDIGTNAYNSTIGGGSDNNIASDAWGSTIAGGQSNDIGMNARYSVIGGGENNNIAAAGSFSLAYNTIAGGRANDIGTNSTHSSIGGGGSNTNGAYSPFCTIAGGGANAIGTNSEASAIGGGEENDIGTNSQTSVIGGGLDNNIGNSSFSSTIAGGRFNDIGTNSDFSFVGGGVFNEIGPNAESATIGGGSDNSIQANADYATIPGGYGNVAFGAYSFAAGRRAHAQAPGAFVWADSQDADFGGGVPNSVSFRCAGGVRFDSGSGQTATWLPGFLNWSISSDRNLKDRVTDLDTREVLDKVSRLPLTEWSFKGHSQRHIGPMAQDFHALFPLNETDTMIDSGDLQGVALAAIQGLNQKVNEQQTDLQRKLEQKETEITELKARLTGLERIISSLNTKEN